MEMVDCEICSVSLVSDKGKVVQHMKKTHRMNQIAANFLANQMLLAAVNSEGPDVVKECFKCGKIFRNDLLEEHIDEEHKDFRETIEDSWLKLPNGKRVFSTIEDDDEDPLLPFLNDNDDEETEENHNYRDEVGQPRSKRFRRMQDEEDEDSTEDDDEEEEDSESDDELVMFPQPVFNEEERRARSSRFRRS